MQPSAEIALSTLILSLAMDYLYPFHRGFTLKIHPVHTCFIMASALVRPCAGRPYGVLLALACLSAHMGPAALAMYLASQAPRPWDALLTIVTGSWILKTSFSLKLQIDIGLNVYRHAAKGDWAGARHWAQQMVRRDVRKLDEEHVLSAAIESQAESLVDGIVSPLFYYPFLGVLGPLLQRLANTLDGAVGYRTPELEKQGWFSARLDTALNYIPARLAALYIAVSSMILGYDWRGSLRIWMRDRGKTESLNAGHPMSAMAGALGIRLEKVGSYALGDRLRPIEPGDVLRTVKIVAVATTIHTILVTLAVILIRS